MNVFHLVVRIKNNIEHFVLTITNSRNEATAKANAEGQGLQVSSIHTDHAEAARAAGEANENASADSVIGEPRTLDAVLAQADAAKEDHSA